MVGESQTVNLSPFKEVFAIATVRQLLLISLLGKIPYSAASLVLTLHVVSVLERSYAQAGIVAAATTVGLAIGSPWRGRLTDRFGLRRTLIPSIIAEPVLFALAGFVSFGYLVGISFLLGLFMIPLFSVVRQSMSVVVPIDLRRTAFSADGIAGELNFIIGPALGIWAAHQFGSKPTLIGLGVLAGIVGLVLWMLNVPTRSENEASSTETKSSAQMFNTSLIFVLLLAGGTTFALYGTDLSIFAHLRELDSLWALGLVFFTWGGASIIGGVIYGAMPRSLRPSHLALAMALMTIPIGLADSTFALSIAVIPAGLLCAPTIAAVAEWISHLVPEERRGEAMGWQGTAFTVGGAISAPLTGAAIDSMGAWGGYAIAGFVAALIAAATLITQSTLRKSAKHLHP